MSKGQILNTLHDVGSLGPRDQFRTGGFDTPSLVGVSQTSPYLHNGSALTLMDVFREKKHLNAGIKAGPERELSSKELDDLVAFVNSITEGTEPVTP